MSSLIAYYVAKNVLSSRELPILVSLAVRSHHGHLKGIDTVMRWAEHKKHYPGVLEPQFLNLIRSKDRILEDMSNIRHHSHVEMFLEQDLRSAIKEYTSDLKKLKDQLEKDRSRAWERYLEGLLLFSCLIDSDKHSASDTPFLSQSPPSSSLITQYLSSVKRNDRMAKLRERLNSLVSSIEVNRTLTLIAPTGSGKTLSGVLAALRMGKSRLIYALPYISIVEQVHDVLSRAGLDPLKFYHLYPGVDPRNPDREDVSAEDQLMIAESWDHPVIVTTFEALVASILSPGNRSLRRLHSIAGSTLILDEVQAIPVEYQFLVREALKSLVDYLDVNLVLMSATVNRLISLDPVVELKAEGDTVNRYSVNFKLDMNSPEDLATMARQEFSRGNSVMVEVNTIATAREVFQSLRDLGAYYLSTHVTPHDRRRRIDLLKRKMEREKVILVTTQVVEAGVDLDFDVVIRDFAPLDSVVQAAGRCNRNWRMERGAVIVPEVTREGRSDFERIYGRIAHQVTSEIVGDLLSRGVNPVTEADLTPLLSRYYDIVNQRYHADQVNEYVQVKKEIEGLNFDNVSVSLIQEEPKYPVYVNLTDEAREILEKVKTAKRQRESRQRMRLLLSQAMDYVIRVWEEPGLAVDKDLGWYILDDESRYDKRMGYVPRMEEQLLW